MGAKAVSRPVRIPEPRRPGKPPAPSGAVRRREKACRTILSPSGIPGMDYSINPYVGCEHGCVYCYARHMKRYSGHDEPWGEFVDVKVNAPGVLARQLRRTPPSSIFMSSVTDPYQPAERHYRLTRRLLALLSPLPHCLHIHTKSNLVERDIDILRRFRKASVCFTIVTGDDEAAARLEPRAPSISERVSALAALARAGISTSVFIGPVIPLLTERNLTHLLQRLARAGVRKIMLDDLHYLPRIRELLLRALESYDERIARRFRLVPKEYYQQIGRNVLEFCRRSGIRCSCYF